MDKKNIELDDSQTEILDRIESENLHLEKEEVLEDNSILLTIEV